MNNGVLFSQIFFFLKHLESGLISGLNNTDKTPFVNSFTGLGAAFHNPNNESFGEILTREWHNKGAVGYFGFSTNVLTTVNQDFTCPTVITFPVTVRNNATLTIPENCSLTFSGSQKRHLSLIKALCLQQFHKRKM